MGFLWLLNDSEWISENYSRIYAVTMKNTPITVGFGVIVGAQLAVGISLITLAAEGGGETQLRTRKNYDSFRASAYSSTVPTNTS